MTKTEGIEAQTIIFEAMAKLYAEIQTDRRFHFAQKRAYSTLRDAANYIASQVEVS